LKKGHEIKITDVNGVSLFFVIKDISLESNDSKSDVEADEDGKLEIFL